VRELPHPANEPALPLDLKPWVFLHLSDECWKARFRIGRLNCRSRTQGFRFLLFSFGRIRRAVRVFTASRQASKRARVALRSFCRSMSISRSALLIAIPPRLAARASWLPQNLFNNPRRLNDTFLKDSSSHDALRQRRCG